uniref:cobyric acid synthase n=1 Tax=uncultured Bilophila sp. TaxID=529385 RepID=UPI00280C1AAB
EGIDTIGDRFTIRAELPAWSVNAFALAAAQAVFADASGFAEQTRAENAERRADLVTALSTLPGIAAYPSAANYVLFRWPGAPRGLLGILLKRFGIAVRDCSNYHGLGDGSWFRAAVRFPEEHRRLAEALWEIGEEMRNGDSPSPLPRPSQNSRLAETPGHGPETASQSPTDKGFDVEPSGDTAPSPPDSKSKTAASVPSGSGNSESGNKDSMNTEVLEKRGDGGLEEGERPPLLQKGFLSPSPGVLARSPLRTPALMLQGTSSNAGKSILAAAYCRIFRQDGYNVAPFKAQNMSLNSGVTAAGDEMGRAQIVQAQAARVDPDARMNPILLKPHSDTGSQVVVLGQPIGHMGVLDYFKKKKELWETVAQAYDSLAADHDVMVLEGAGSPGEINLKTHDVVNMRMADYARASVLLVGDIDRGGVYASFLGTWMTFTDAERRLLTGYIVNRFRGDASLLAPAHEYMLDHTGTPVLGTIPHIRDLNIPEEDMAGFSWGYADCGDKEAGTLDIAVVMLRHVSNYTDFAPLAAEPDVRLRPVRRVEEWGDPDVVMLPGSKSVVPDLEDLRRAGLAEKILGHAERGKWIFGICGGLQVLGRTILDPYGIESAAPEVPGLGLMDLRSTFAADKTLVRVSRAETPLGIPSGGYEIHHGLTEHGPSAQPLFLRADRAYPSEDDRICGYAAGRRWATYLHGIFDDDAFRRAWLDHVRADLGLTPQGRQLATYDLEKALDRLADIVREHSDMETIYRSIGLK